MSLSPQLRSALQRDAARSTPRWSLRSLADLASADDADNASISRTASQTLLQCAVERLAQQHEWLQLWKDNIANNSGVPHSVSRNVHRQLDTLQYVHADTYRLGRRLLDNDTFWERFRDPERHTANAVVLELRARHATTIKKVVDIVTELRRQQQQQQRSDSNDNDRQQQQQSQYKYYADAFMQRRVGIQLLCDHHVELCRKGAKRQPHGGVAVAAPLGRILTDAVLEAQHVVDVHLQIYPETRYEADTKRRCTLVRPWVHHALVELLKNAMGATVQQMRQQREDSCSTIPAPVDILLSTISATSSSTIVNDENGTDSAKGAAIAIDIVDRGTGIAGGEEGLARVFELGHSSTERRWDRLDEQQSYAAVRSPLSSLGVGLPTSMYMMEHFGGQLTLRNNNNSSGGGDDGVLGGCTARIVLPADDTILERVPGEPVQCKYH